MFDGLFVFAFGVLVGYLLRMTWWIDSPSQRRRLATVPPPADSAEPIVTMPAAAARIKPSAHWAIQHHEPRNLLWNQKSWEPSRDLEREPVTEEERRLVDRQTLQDIRKEIE